MTIRQGRLNDIDHLRQLALASWGQFQDHLTPDNWQKLLNTLTTSNTYVELLEKSYSFVCENEDKEIIGMAFLVPNGNPTEIYQPEWCYIRFVTVAPTCSGKGIGRLLTETCIDKARSNNEKTIALHTSEMMNKARHIYESLGFTVLRELKPRFGKKYWLYTLDITPNKKGMQPLP